MLHAHELIPSESIMRLEKTELQNAEHQQKLVFVFNAFAPKMYLGEKKLKSYS